MKLETIRRLGEKLDGGNPSKRRIRAYRDRLITGTRLLGRRQSVECIGTVKTDGFEGRGGPTSRFAPSRAPSTGTRWNDWVFLSLKNHSERT